MRRTGAYLKFPLILAAVVLMAGCWNYRELNTMMIVAGIAVDKGGENGKYHVTFETLDVSGGSGEKQSSIKSLLIESDGDTIFDTARNALEKSDKRLYFGACEIVIISDELAREGIANILDWVGRDAEPRISIDIYVAKGKSAKEVIGRKSLTDPITSYALGRMDEIGRTSLSKSVYVQLYKANNMLGGEGISLVLPTLNTVSNKDTEIPVYGGTAIFKKDKLVGYLSDDESKYLAMIKNEVFGGLLLVGVDSGAPDISLEIMENNVQITPVLTGDRPKIKVAVTMKAALGEMETAVDLASQQGMAKAEKAASENIAANIARVIKKAQDEYGSDIFGFGNAIFKTAPGYWYSIKPGWDAMFRSLDISISAKVEIANTGELMKKAKVNE